MQIDLRDLRTDARRVVASTAVPREGDFLTCSLPTGEPARRFRVDSVEWSLLDETFDVPWLAVLVNLGPAE